jgi:signal transduction histidine kinase/ActR/RegA family two-component response regulator
MLQALERLEAERETRVLRSLIHPLLVVCLLAIPVLWIPGATGAPLFGTLMSLVMAALLTTCELLIRRQRFRAASSMFLGVFVVAGCIGFFFFGGLHGPYVALLPLLVCIGGLLRGRGAALVIMALLLAVLLAAFVLETVGLHPGNLDPENLLTDLCVVASLVALGGVFVWVALRRLELARRDREAFERERREATRLEGLGRLAGGVAHDFNNLLTVVLANADPSWDGASLTPEVRERLAQIQEAGNRARQLTGQLLAFARRQILEPRVVDLTGLVKGMQGILARLLREDVSLRISLAPQLKCVRLDPTRIEQVILNLVLNAQEAMPQGGVLTVETGNARLDTEACARHPGLLPGDYVLISVSDTGVGIPPEALDRIFDPFYTTKRERGGTGLGLATVHGVVKQSGGHVLVYSEPGKGSTFKVYLPAVAEGPAPAVVPQPLADLAARGETVLVVDDDSMVREATSRMLVRLGYQTLSAADGVEALDLAGRHRGLIHLLLSDVVMPHMSGRVLAETLRNQHPGLRVLFVSGYAEEAIQGNGHLEPGAHFLSKPFTLTQLGEGVRRVLAAEPSREPGK